MTASTWTSDDAFDLVRRASRIQIGQPLPASYLDAVKIASRNFPDRGLTVFGDSFSGDLEGLRGFEHIRDLIVLLQGATSFEVLSGFTRLRSLVIGRTRSTRPSMDFLANCAELEDVELEGSNRGLGAVTVLRRLKTLRLRNLRAKSLEFLDHQPSIERLEILYASTTDLAPLSTMKSLRRLWAGRVRGLQSEHLGPLAAVTLDMLALNDAPQLESLEALNQPHVRHLSLDNLSSLRTLQSLQDWPALEVVGVRNSRPSDGSLIDVVRNPSLKHLAIAGRLPQDELRTIQREFDGYSLWYQGEYLFGTDHPRDIIAERTDL